MSSLQGPDPVVYTVDITTLYKTDPLVKLGQQLEFVSGGAECDVGLTRGEDYLLGLYWDSAGLLRVASCGLYWRWILVQEPEVALLESGCSCNGECGEGQVSESVVIWLPQNVHERRAGCCIDRPPRIISKTATRLTLNPRSLMVAGD